MTSPSKLRVGIAGFGVVGERRRQHVDAHPDLVTVAVCDRRFDGSGRLADGLVRHDNYKRLLEEDLDILFVCLTNDIAAEVTIAGLERGLHVFCEKPPGRDLDDIVAVLRTARERPGQKLKYGFNHRYHDSVRDALAILRSGELGRVLNLRGVYGKSKIINFQSEWRTRRAIAGGGILLDQGIHMVDLVRLFAGEFEEIHAFITNEHWHHDVEDNAFAMLRNSAGIVAQIHSSATEWRHRFRLEITLEEGSIALSGLLTGSKSYGAETLTIARKADDDLGDPREVTTRYNTDPSWADEIAEFADAVRDDIPIQSGSALEALKTMHLVYRIYEADPVWSAQWGLDADLPDDILEMLR
ncbi:MAG: Gfo/Idh/MocA family oxidoreductase [Rhodospirillales bacterium]